MSLDILTTQALDVLNTQANRVLFEITDNPLFAKWDLLSAITNATVFAKLVIGSLIVLFGTCAVGWAVYKFFGKLGNSQSSAQTSWFTIAVLFIAGGAAVAGGGTFIFDIAQGGKDTIEQLGGGTILPYFLTMWL